LGIDQILVRARVTRPAMATSIAIVLASLALLSLDVRPRRGPAPAELIAAGVAAIGSLTLGGYAFGDIQFYMRDRHHEGGMAVHTALALVVLAIGIVTARPASGAMAIVTSPLVGGQVIRRTLPIGLSIVVVGYLAAKGQQAGLYAPPGAAVVATAASAFVAGTLTLVVGQSVNRADAERRRVEQESREWKRFFDCATFGAAFGTIDGKLGRINEAFARMHGCSIDELEGMPIADVFPPHRHAELAEKIRTMEERGSCRWESEHVRKDGSVFPVCIDLSEIRDARGTLLYRAAIIQDITEEKRAEAVQARLCALVQSADDAIVAKTLDGIVLDWNRGAERVYGYTAEEMRGRSILILVPEDRRAERDAIHAQVLRGEIVVGFETIRVRKDGRRIPIALTVSPIRDAAGSVVGISTIERDISVRKQLQAELERTRDREMAQRMWLEAVIDNTPEGIVIVDEHAEVVRQNATAAAFMTGAGPLGPEGRPMPYDVRAPSGERLDFESLPIIRALRYGERSCSRELAAVASSGELVPLLTSAAPIDLDGARRGAITVFRDIRQLKALEREREEWASIVAHDLRQPAAVIRLAVDNLEQVEGAAHDQAVQRIRRAADHLERMIQDLLDVSRIEARRLSVRAERTAVSALIGEALDAAPHVALRCRTEMEPAADWVWTDEERVVQVLSNLLSNADKYSDPGTPIDVRVEGRDELVEISVTNEGPGIAPDEIPQLFSRFARTRSARSGRVPGLGLGLYICRGIVEALGGHLWVESVPGEKTCFRFTLPRAAESADRLTA
jgi:PAS domain S-box-containing protein